MEYSDEYLREQLPAEDPPAEFVPGDVNREIASWSERIKADDPKLLARSVRWTYAIFSELGIGNFRIERGFAASRWADYVNPYWGRDWISEIIVGLWDKATESSGFGLSVNVPSSSIAPPFYIVDYLTFPRLGQKFQLALRAVETDLHGPIHPSNATSACWARCNSTKAWGIITAGHAVGGNYPGLSIPLDNGTKGLLSRCYWQPIDAAFILTTPAVSHSVLPVCRFPAAGLPVTVGCKSGLQNRTIVSANNSMGFLNTRQYPILLYIDQPCVRGDSGSLVRLTSGEAAGIYKGSQPSPSVGGSCGLVQNFEQAMFALDTTPYL